MVVVGKKLLSGVLLVTVCVKAEGVPESTKGGVGVDGSPVAFQPLAREGSHLYQGKRSLQPLKSAVVKVSVPITVVGRSDALSDYYAYNTTDSERGCSAKEEAEDAGRPFYSCNKSDAETDCDDKRLASADGRLYYSCGELDNEAQCEAKRQAAADGLLYF